MKRLLKSLLFITIVLFTVPMNAQLLKKLKDKVNKKIDQTEQKLTNKVDQEIDKTLDGTIDGLFESNSETPTFSETSESTNASQKNNKTYSGSINLDHAQKYGNVQINTLDNLKIERTNEGYNFYGNWFSHEVDIFDGYKLEITTNDNLELGKTYTFNIPKNASLRLGYDPELPGTKESVGNFKRGVSDEYQNIDLNSGLVKVTINQDKSFELDFSGQAEFVERTRTSTDEVNESKYASSVMGNVQGTNPRFLDNKKTTKSASTTAATSAVSNKNSSSNSSQAKDSYRFTYETVIEMRTPDQKKPYKLSYLLSTNSNYVGMKADMNDYSDGEMGGESVIVMDGEEVFMFVDTPGMKIQMAAGQMGGKAAMSQTEQMENYDYTNLKKTGNTKTILGYTCHEYVMSDNKNAIQLWVAPDLAVPNWFVPNQNLIEGHILEYSVDSTEGQMTYTTVEIKDNINKTINPKEYRKMF